MYVCTPIYVYDDDDNMMRVRTISKIIIIFNWLNKNNERKPPSTIHKIHLYFNTFSYLKFKKKINK